jgi:hypothetical protein
VHSANRARLDSPAFHLVQALNTLVTADGEPAIEGFADAARPPSAAEHAMLDAIAHEGGHGQTAANRRVVRRLPERAGGHRLRDLEAASQNLSPKLSGK